MKRYQRIEISVERTRIFAAKRRESTRRDWCKSCEVLVDMVTPDDATSITGIGSREIYRLIEANEFHFSETEEGSIRICLNSLLHR